MALILTSYWLLASAPSAPGAVRRGLPTEPFDFEKVHWISTPADARRVALEVGRPILVFASAPGCPWCAAQEEEWEKDELQPLLCEWVLLKLDCAERPEEAQALGVFGVPALRALSVLGEEATRWDGYLPGEDLKSWLTGSLKEARELAAAVGAALSSTGPMTAERAAELVALLGHRSPTVREAVTVRVVKEPTLSAAAVVEALAEGNLALKLGALECLRLWGAPMGGLDPWVPESLPGALAELRAWVEAGRFDGGRPTEAEVERDFETLLTADEGRARSALLRLAGLGEELLPTVRERMNEATGDRERARLALLRYRLTMPGDFARLHPESLELLASPDSADRIAVVRDLAATGDAGLEKLFLELFQDPDPVVRELALRGFRRACGRRANATLTQLLGDPNLNVRAAVLKELAQEPGKDVLPLLVDYLKVEEDEDLMVAAVRVLREIEETETLDLLVTLADRESWRVRAELAGALGEVGQRSSYSGRGGDAAQLAKGANALLSLLADDDSFVVAQAMKALGYYRFADASEELASVAVRFPELAPEALETMVSDPRTKRKALPHLKKFLDSPELRIRAAAVSAYAQVTDSPLVPEVLTAISDPETEVRQAAVNALVSQLRGSGTHLSRVKSKLIEQARPLLGAEDPAEAVAASRLLAVLGETDEAVARMKELAGAHPELQESIAEALSWLPYQARRQLFGELQAVGMTDAALHQAIYALTQSPSLQAGEFIWQVAESDPRALGSLSSLHSGLLEAYLGDEYWQPSRAPSSRRKRLADDAKERLSAGDVRLRVLALLVLFEVDPGTGSKQAVELYEAEDTDPVVKQNAFRLLCCYMPGKWGNEKAVEVLQGKTSELAPTALALLARGPGTVQWLEVGQEHLYMRDTPHESSYSSTSTSSELPTLPQGLTAEHVRPYLDSVDEQTQGDAAFLLACLGDPAGLDVLVSLWQWDQQGSWREQLYRAIAAVGDESHASLLEEIYSTYDTDGDRWEIKTFYWTIRRMRGDSVQRLRQRIRKEVGVRNLM